jgi:hypothetical protein
VTRAVTPAAIEAKRAAAVLKRQQRMHLVENQRRGAGMHARGGVTLSTPISPTLGMAPLTSQKTSAPTSQVLPPPVLAAEGVVTWISPRVVQHCISMAPTKGDAVIGVPKLEPEWLEIWNVKPTKLRPRKAPSIQPAPTITEADAVVQPPSIKEDRAAVVAKRRSHTPNGDGKKNADVVPF